MKLNFTIIILALLMPAISFAQQFTPITEMQRQAAEANYYRRQSQHQAFEQGAVIGKTMNERREAQREHEIEIALNSPDLILDSRNGLPSIIISKLPAGRCKAPNRAAFTTDKNGQTVPGCSKVSGNTVSVFWNGYGNRDYSLSEWTSRQPRSADDAPLGAD